MKDTVNAVNIVLVEPEIPQNTGNIARTCAATGAALHLVKPMGFTPTDAKLKRAGLDYWDKLDITYYESLADFLACHGRDALFLFSAHGVKSFADVVYPKPVYLLFGRESSGLPASLRAAYPDRLLRIPMRDDLRCLNLSNAVAVAVYEVFRQSRFAGLH